MRLDQNPKSLGARLSHIDAGNCWNFTCWVAGLGQMVGGFLYLALFNAICD